MFKLTLKIFLIVAMIGAIPLFADIVALGEGVDIGSWTQKFRRGGDSLDRMAVQMLTDAITFVAGSNTGFGDFSLSGWHDDLTNSGAGAVASGPGSHDIEFNLYFSPPRREKSFTFNFTAWDGHNLRESTDAHWDSDRREWSFCHDTPPVAHVPEASTMVFRGGWLLGLALLIIRRKGLGCTAA